MKTVVALLLSIALLSGLAIPAQAAPVIGTYAVYVGYDYDTDGNTIHDPVGPGIPVSIYHDGKLYTRVYTDERSIAIAYLPEDATYEVFIHCGFTEDGSQVWRDYSYMRFWTIGLVERECELKPAHQTYLASLFSN